MVQPDNLGDVLLAAPAVGLLAAALPGVQFTYLVGPWSAEAARHGPLGDSVEVFRYPGFARGHRGPLWAPYVALLQLGWRLRARRFEAVVLVRPDHWWGGLLALTAGIPARVGHGTPLLAPALTHTLPDAPREHATPRALALARLALTALGAGPTPGETAHQPAFRLTPTDRAAAATWLAEHGLAASRTVALHPFAGAPLKTWPSDRWVGLAGRLAREGYGVVLSGGPGEGSDLLALASRSEGAQPPAILVDRPLGEVAAVFRSLAAAVGPDSGALHLAAAVGTPTVRLYGPAPPAVFGPAPGTPGQLVLITNSLPCVSCGFLANPPCGVEREPPCFRALTVDEVLAAVLAATGGVAAGGP